MTVRIRYFPAYRQLHLVRLPRQPSGHRNSKVNHNCRHSQLPSPHRVTQPALPNNSRTRTSVVSRPECGPQRLPRQLLPHAAVGIPHDHHSTVFTIDGSPIDIITAGLYGLYVRRHIVNTARLKIRRRIYLRKVLPSREPIYMHPPSRRAHTAVYEKKTPGDKVSARSAKARPSVRRYLHHACIP